MAGGRRADCAQGGSLCTRIPDQGISRLKAPRRGPIRSPPSGWRKIDVYPATDETAMKTSARNSIPGKITNLKLGPVSTEVTISVAAGIDIVSVISTGSAESLGLKVGMPAFAVIKATSVMVGVEHP
jgi:molybdopterin-binding protein